jgi:hypothetical protein
MPGDKILPSTQEGKNLFAFLGGGRIFSKAGQKISSS